MENLQQMVSYVQCFEDMFIKQQLEKSSEVQKQVLQNKKRELAKAQKRVNEIYILFQRVYEDNVSGKITNERFKLLSNNYETEQKDLKPQIDILSTEITELTPDILNEFIEKIMVHQQEKIDGKKYQQIDIYYNGVGIIQVPLDEFEMEQAFQEKIKTA